MAKKKNAKLYKNPKCNVFFTPTIAVQKNRFKQNNYFKVNHHLKTIRKSTRENAFKFGKLKYGCRGMRKEKYTSRKATNRGCEFNNIM